MRKFQRKAWEFRAGHRFLPPSSCSLFISSSPHKGSEAASARMSFASERKREEKKRKRNWGNCCGRRRPNFSCMGERLENRESSIGKENRKKNLCVFPFTQPNQGQPSRIDNGFTIFSCFSIPGLFSGFLSGAPHAAPPAAAASAAAAEHLSSLAAAAAAAGRGGWPHVPPPHHGGVTPGECGIKQ